MGDPILLPASGGGGPGAATGRLVRLRPLAVGLLLWLSPAVTPCGSPAATPAFDLPPPPGQAYRLWRTRCLAHLAEAQREAALLDPAVAAGQIRIGQNMERHGSDEEFAHEWFGFEAEGGEDEGWFRVMLRVREAGYEDSDAYPVWYPANAAFIPKLDKRYYENFEHENKLLDNAPESEAGKYEYSRRTNHVIATINAERPPAEIRTLLRYFEPAADACLFEGRLLPPRPCARLATLPPRPAPEPDVLRSAPPLAIEVRGMPPQGRLHLGLGDWQHREDRPLPSGVRWPESESGTVVLKPQGWFTPFQTWHRFSYGFDPRPPRRPPLRPEEGAEVGMLVTGTAIPADGTETAIRVEVDLDETGRITIASERSLPSLKGVSLRPDWTPGSSGEPAYLLINQTQEYLVGTGFAELFEYQLESRQGDRWVPYPAVTAALDDGDKKPKKMKCGNYSHHPAISPGDWDFIRYGARLNFPPGRYRFVVEYGSRPVSGEARHRVRASAAAEFHVP